MKSMDVAIVILIASFAIMESRRGFAMTLIDFFGTIASIKFAWALYPRLQSSMVEWFHLTAQGGNLAACIALFTLFIMVTFVGSKIFHDMTQLSLGEGVDSLCGLFGYWRRYSCSAWVSDHAQSIREYGMAISDQGISPCQ
jgi:uncharacterized membrane protein required for colicin V production